MHGSTFGGNPVACAAALATLDLVEARPDRQRRESAAQLLARAAGAAWPAQPLLADVRGRGLMIGIDFADHDTAAAVEQACFRRGLLVLTCGERSVRLAPPLVIRPTRSTLRSRCWRTQSPPSPRRGSRARRPSSRSRPARYGGAARRPAAAPGPRRWAGRAPCGRAPRRTVSAAQRLLMTASSDASTTAANKGCSASSSMGRRPVGAPPVLNAAKISPLPWRATEPARARPRPTRRARRSSWRGEHGASVATMPMQLPASPPSGAAPAAAGACDRRARRPR